jgi:hypothetical protein
VASALPLAESFFSFNARKNFLVLRTSTECFLEKLEATIGSRSCRRLFRSAQFLSWQATMMELNGKSTAARRKFIYLHAHAGIYRCPFPTDTA